MGRLFWKFLFFFWLAQMLTAFGVGLTIWLKQPPSGIAPPAGPPPAAWQPHAPAAWPLPPGAHRPPGPPSHPFARPPPPPPPRGLLPWPPLLIGALVSLMLAALLAWYVAKPIRSLRAAFHAAAEGRLGEPLAPAMGRRRDELADLGRDFDHMAGHLQQLMLSQRRLLHDVSHELRSPLARLQAAIGLAHQQPTRNAEMLERIEREAQRMETLVGELLTLSRLEAGMAGPFDERLDLHLLLTDIVADVRFESELRGDQVSWQASEATAWVQGHASLLHHALENIVRNALLHAVPGHAATVEVTLARHPGAWRIAVSDRGPGVPEAELETIFAPFFRGHGTASSTGGYGLGLAIAQQVILAHQGRIKASNRPGGGLCVAIELPGLDETGLDLPSPSHERLPAGAREHFGSH